MLDHLFQAGIVPRLVYATCAGLILGIPYRHRPGGIRAHVLVTLGAAYFCATALAVTGGENREVIRVVQGVVSGIGFVGAASVLKMDGTIYGVSTAASIWIAAAVGCDAALGSGVSVLLSAPAITVISLLVERIEVRRFPKGHRPPASKKEHPP